MKTTTESQQKWLLKRYHTLATRLGLRDYEKAAIVGAYGADSSRYLTTNQLAEICDRLDRQLNPEIDELNTWRKRVIASIGGWMKLVNMDSSAYHIKAIACRASGIKGFNNIPKERLINLYNAFLAKQKDYKRVAQITAEEIEIITYMN